MSDGEVRPGPGDAEAEALTAVLAVKLAGLEYGPPWDGVDVEQDPQWEWRTGAQDDPDSVRGDAAQAVATALDPLSSTKVLISNVLPEGAT